MSEAEKGQSSNGYYERQTNFAPRPSKIANPGAL